MLSLSVPHSPFCTFGQTDPLNCKSKCIPSWSNNNNNFGMGTCEDNEQSDKATVETYVRANTHYGINKFIMSLSKPL